MYIPKSKCKITTSKTLLPLCKRVFEVRFGGNRITSWQKPENLFTHVFEAIKNLNFF
jgi:hypothetical protein